MEVNQSSNKRKTFPDDKKLRKENESIGEETQKLFKKLDDEPNLFTEIITQEKIPDKKPSKKKRKLKEISSNTDESEDDESIEINRKPKSGKTKKTTSLELDERDKKGKDTRRSLTKEKEKISKNKKQDGKETKDRTANQKKLSDKEATTMIQNYMIKQNRPYSVQNVMDNLAGQIKKAQCQKILDTLVDQGILIVKEYNVKIYLANQNQFEKVDQKDLNDLDSKIEKSIANINELKENNSKLSTEFKSLNEILSNEELDRRLAYKSKQLEELGKNLEKFSANRMPEILDDKIKEAEKIYEENKMMYKKTRKLCMGVMDYLCENMDISRKQFMELVGIEEDSEMISKLKIVLN